MPADPQPPIIVTIRGDSPLAVELRRAALAVSVRAELLAATFAEQTLESFFEDAGTREFLAARAREIDLASQMLGV